MNKRMKNKMIEIYELEELIYSPYGTIYYIDEDNHICELSVGYNNMDYSFWIEGDKLVYSYETDEEEYVCSIPLSNIFTTYEDAERYNDADY